VKVFSLTRFPEGLPTMCGRAHPNMLLDTKLFTYNTLQRFLLKSPLPSVIRCQTAGNCRADRDFLIVIRASTREGRILVFTDARIIVNNSVDQCPEAPSPSTRRGISH
jgi:hypothetical protein